MPTVSGSTTIRVNIDAQTPDGLFSDAIYMTADEYRGATAADIAALKEARVQNWRNQVAEARKPRPAPTREEKRAQREALREQERLVKEQAAQIDEPETRAELVTRRDELKAELDQVTAKLAGLRG